MASIADDGKLIIWEMTTYPDRLSGTKSAAGSLSPSKHDGEDYNFDADLSKKEKERKREREKEKETLRPVMEWLVVDGSKDKRMVALEWSPEYHEDRMLVAA